MVVFIVGLILVEARRLHWAPADWVEHLVSNHFEAIRLPFTLPLLAEVISLVFAIALTWLYNRTVSGESPVES